MKVSRNARCPCGSGKKFKKCHLPVLEREQFHPPEGEAAHLPLMPPLKEAQQVVDALEEAHYFWHQAEETYHEPEKFRANLNALIQALRNVTFRIQSAKGLVSDFDAWYEPWQEHMRSLSTLKWLHDARTQVVKKAGLKAHSVANVALVWSYNEPSSVELQLDPTESTETLVDVACAAAPREVVGNSVVEIERRWKVDDLPDAELLDGLAECLEVLLAIVEDFRGALKSDAAVSPTQAVADIVRPSCLVRPQEARVLRVNTATGERYTHESVMRRLDYVAPAVPKERYGLSPDMLKGVDVEDPISYASALLSIAVTILKRDRYHSPMLLLHRPQGGWTHQVLLSEDQLDRYLLWRRVASEVESHGYDGFIFVTEVWMAEATRIPPSPYPQISELPGRREALSVTAASADGRRKHWFVPFKRRLGRAVPGPAEEAPLEGIWFGSPVEHVWKRLRETK